MHMLAFLLSSVCAYMNTHLTNTLTAALEILYKYTQNYIRDTYVYSCNTVNVYTSSTLDIGTYDIGQKVNVV